LDYHQDQAIITKKKDVNKQELNTMSLNEFENEVKEQHIVPGLVAKEISRNSLMELPKEVNIANIKCPKEFAKEVHEKSVMPPLFVKVYGDSLIELPEKISAMLGEFQDSYHSNFTNFSTFMLDTQLVIDFEQHSELHDSSPLCLTSNIS
jgi:hypothetical protein